MPSALSMACLLALKRHHDCLVLATKEVQQGTSNPDVFVLRARLYNSFQKVELMVVGGVGSRSPGELGALSQPSRRLSPPLGAVLLGRGGGVGIWFSTQY